MKTYSNRELKNKLLARWEDLKRDRAVWITRWQEVCRYVDPYSGKFNITDKGSMRSMNKIYDNEAGRCLNKLVSGFASSVTSPSQKWFKIAPPNPEYEMDHDVQLWCNKVQELLSKIFQQSNTYTALHQVYKELCLFGVAVDLIYDDFNNIIKHNVLSAGQYCIQTNSEGIVDTLYREFSLTVAQAVEKFGKENLSQSVKEMYKKGILDEQVLFLHVIEPRAIRNIDSNLAIDMPYASYYLEQDRDSDTILKEGGFKVFPALCPRWEVNTNEVYGTSPSLIGLPDIKQLQFETVRKSELIDKQANPPMQAPNSARQNPISLTAGQINFTSNTGQDNAIKPIMGATDIQPILVSIEGLKQTINQNFYIDLFLLLQSDPSDRKTATEIMGLQQEKMLVLGSVIERLQKELLSPLIQITFNKLVEGQILPPAPSMLEQSGLEVEFQSALFQAQKSGDINTIDRFISSMQAMSSTNPDVLDRIDFDGVVDVYANKLSVDPRAIRSKEKAEEIRQQRAQAQQQMAQAQQAEQYGSALNSFANAQKLGAEASAVTQQLEPVGNGAII